MRLKIEFARLVAVQIAVFAAAIWAAFSG